jgi:hypothetical protein
MTLKHLDSVLTRHDFRRKWHTDSAIGDHSIKQHKVYKEANMAYIFNLPSGDPPHRPTAVSLWTVWSPSKQICRITDWSLHLVSAEDSGKQLSDINSPVLRWRPSSQDPLRVTDPTHNPMLEVENRYLQSDGWKSSPYNERQDARHVSDRQRCFYTIVVKKTGC